MEIEVSIGEVVDKYTILLIKKEMIDDTTKVANVENELNYLTTILTINQPDVLNDVLTSQLQSVNKDLWVVEDKIRDYERIKVFEGEFISLARSVYKLNDTRASIKKEINLKYNSVFIEEKSYKEY